MSKQNKNAQAQQQQMPPNDFEDEMEVSDDEEGL